MRAKPVISLSTSYLQTKFGDDGYAMLCRAAELGFEYVELGHSTPNGAIEGITKAVEEGVVKVSSLHNFCPIPPFVKGATPNLFSPATRSAIESGQWIRHTETTLDFAGKFGAKAVVCHLGELSYFFRPLAAAFEKYRLEHDGEDLQSDLRFRWITDKFKADSAKRSERRDYRRIEKNIRKIAPKAAEKGVILGLENRDGVSELPLDWNFEKLVDKLKDDTPSRSWHDVGHSMRKELLGLCKQEDLLERTRGSIAGWHLHDCDENGKDHIAVGAGIIDFKKIAEFFDAESQIFTIELNRSVRSADAADSLKRVQDMF